jgi:Domain of unknown function (DUF4149)
MVLRLEQLRRLLPGLWAGFLLCVATVATPAAFALLPAAEAGRVAGRILAQEAHISLVLGMLVLVLERLSAKRLSEAGQGPQFSVGMVLALVTLFCTVAGYFALQPMMPAARAGQGLLSFGQLHAASAAFFGVKGLAVLVLAWRASGPSFSRTASS